MQAGALVARHNFVVWRASNETREFTLTIGDEAFG
jgi:hypothetical protein